MFYVLVPVSSRFIVGGRDQFSFSRLTNLLPVSDCCGLGCFLTFYILILVTLTRHSRMVTFTRTLSARMRRWQRRRSYDQTATLLLRLTENDHYPPYVYPGLVRMSQERAVTINMRCPATLYQRSFSHVSDTCAICLDRLRPGYDIVRTLPCKHFFHSKCKQFSSKQMSPMFKYINAMLT